MEAEKIIKEKEIVHDDEHKDGRCHVTVAACSAVAGEPVCRRTLTSTRPQVAVVVPG